MAVLCHRLPTAPWRALSPPAAAIAEVAGSALEAALASLLERCRGHGGFVPRSPRGVLMPHDRSRQRVWMATTGAGDPVAAICLRGWGEGTGARWSIPLVLVDPRFRRGGLAAGLVREALAAAESEGAAVVFAETRSTWEAASTFWSALADRLAD